MVLEQKSAKSHIIGANRLDIHNRETLNTCNYGTKMIEAKQCVKEAKISE